MARLTKTQRALLTKLTEWGGSARWTTLTRTECGSGTAMEKRGLCRWDRVSAVGGGKILYITDVGRAALAEDK